MSEPRPTYAVTEWYGCYNDSWQGVIVADAFAHPAKFARGLIRRIYQHMIDRGYIAPGDAVVDPFGGVGLGGLDALTFGLHWTGVELEPRFVELGQANIDKWRRDLAMLSDTIGTARLLQGDSRRLVEVVGGGVGAAVSSPPYDNNTVHDDARGVTRLNEKGGTIGRWGSHATGQMGQGDYGSTPGQLGSMRSGDYAAAVSSPPYEGQPVANYDGSMGDMWRETGGTPRQRSGGTLPAEQYNIENPANIANDTGETFWSAARQIVEQTYQVLKPGGYAAWVCKDFVRKGRRVPFSDQWEQLCAAVGFERVERIHALLVEDHGEQLDIFGGAVAKRTESKSFFRRLAEKKGSPRIDHEDVIIMRRPL